MKQKPGEKYIKKNAIWALMDESDARGESLSREDMKQALKARHGVDELKGTITQYMSQWRRAKKEEAQLNAANAEEDEPTEDGDNDVDREPDLKFMRNEIIKNRVRKLVSVAREQCAMGDDEIEKLVIRSLKHILKT